MSCIVCGSSALSEQMTVGSHPVATFFLEDNDAPERTFRLALGQCMDCGTLQSMPPVPHEALIPPYDWLFAREPEEHLDEVVRNIMDLPGVTTNSVIGALTYKDDTTIERFTRKGFRSSWRIKLDDDLGVSNPAANIETVQKMTTPERMAGIAKARGPADILIVRHIFEHAEDPVKFLQGLAELLKPGGILMIEVPDCTSCLQLKDYCMVWEEHSLYFTPETLVQLPSIAGFETQRMDVYPRPFENSLVMLAKKSGAPGKLKVSDAAMAQVKLLETYAAAYEPAKRSLRLHMEYMRSVKGPIALYGAGHLAAAFTNFMGVADLIEFVADDTQQKQGKFLPGARLPILPSSELLNQKIGTCLLALSITNENLVTLKNKSFIDAGGQFLSIFRASPISIFASIDA